MLRCSNCALSLSQVRTCKFALALETYYSFQRQSGISICTWRVEFKDAEFAGWVNLHVSDNFCVFHTFGSIACSRTIPSFPRYFMISVLTSLIPCYFHIFNSSITPCASFMFSPLVVPGFLLACFPLHLIVGPQLLLFLILSISCEILSIFSKFHLCFLVFVLHLCLFLCVLLNSCCLFLPKYPVHLRMSLNISLHFIFKLFPWFNLDFFGSVMFSSCLFSSSLYCWSSTAFVSDLNNSTWYSVHVCLLEFVLHFLCCLLNSCCLFFS